MNRHGNAFWKHTHRAGNNNNDNDDDDDDDDTFKFSLNIVSNFIVDINYFVFFHLNLGLIF